MSAQSAPTLRARNASRVLALADAAVDAKPFAGGAEDDASGEADGGTT